MFISSVRFSKFIAELIQFLLEMINELVQLLGMENIYITILFVNFFKYFPKLIRFIIVSMCTSLK